MDQSTPPNQNKGIIQLTDWQFLQNFYRSFTRLSSVQNWTAIPLNRPDINAIKNDLIRISQSIASEHPHFSNELFTLKDRLFIGYGCLDPQVYGQIFAIIKALINEGNKNCSVSITWMLFS